jgi:hypothetical protein
MRIFLVIVLAASSLFSQTAIRQANGKQDKAKTVTATGCVYEGVECLRFTKPDDPNALLYSIGRTDKLKVGHAYKITGTVSDIGFCQEGKPILTATEITEVRLKCKKPESKDQAKAEPGTKK